MSCIDFWYNYPLDNPYLEIQPNINHNSDYIHKQWMYMGEIEGETISDYSEETIYAGPQSLYGFQRGYSYKEF